MANRSPRRSAVEWQSILDDYVQSGLSVDAFCTDRNIAKSTFGKWRKRLLEQGNESPSEEPVFIPASTLARTSEETLSQSIAFSLPGCKLTIPANLNEAQLRVLLDSVLSR